jgi:hypothetical protein
MCWRADLARQFGQLVDIAGGKGDAKSLAGHQSSERGADTFARAHDQGAGVGRSVVDRAGFNIIHCLLSPEVAEVGARNPQLFRRCGALARYT